MIIWRTIRMFGAVAALVLTVSVCIVGFCGEPDNLLDNIERIKNPKVGQWVMYEIRDAATGSKLTMRQSIVGKETVNGTDYYWLETDMMPRRGNRVVTKILVKDNPSDPANILKIIEKRGQEPAREIPVPKPPSTGQQKKSGATRNVRVEDVGAEKFNTRDGSVETHHYRVKTQSGSIELWTSKQVGLSGLVRRLGPSGDMTLIAYGNSGAESVISTSPSTPVIREQGGTEQNAVREEPKK